MRHRFSLVVLAALWTMVLALMPPAAAAPGVQITAPGHGQTVSGQVAIEADADPAPASMSFSWSPGGETWIDLGTDVDAGDGWSADWETAGYTGPATIRAEAIDPAGAHEIQVTVDNQPPAAAASLTHSAFSPNGDGRKDTTTLEVVTDEAASVIVRLEDGGGSLHRTWGPDPVAPDAPASFVWNGKSGAGILLPDGTYRLTATITDESGNAATPIEKTARIDTQRPTVGWERIRPNPASGRDPLRFRFHVSDAATTLRASLEVRDLVGRVRVHEATVGRGSVVVSWKPRYANGKILPPGTYTAKVTVTDDAANTSLTRSKRFRVQRRVKARVFHRLSGVGRRVAITIDDCGSGGAWRRTLTILKQHKVKATFFCPGGQMRRYPALVRLTVREGHVLGAHAWDHALLSGKGATFTATRLRYDAREAWKIANVTTAPYFRPPYGAYDSGVVAGAGATGHARVMMWDVDTRDSFTHDRIRIARNAIGPARGGSVILMHVLDRTAAALPSIIKGLRKKGLKPVTLPVLFRAAGYR